jgi:hypothetical protein
MNLLDSLLRKHTAYKRCFCDASGNLTDAGRAVLADLAEYASLAKGPTVVSPVSRMVDPLATQQRIGRCDAVLRISRMIRLPVNRIHELHGDLND